MVLTAIVFILILSLLILVHELGHFLVARKNGIRVEEFGFGLPPRLFGKKIGETIYSLNLLPIGGFVKLTGEDPQDIDTEDQNNFSNKSVWRRATVIVAGVTANFVMAALIFTVIFAIGVPVPASKITIKQVLPDTPASVAGLRAGDEILALNDKKLTSSDELVRDTRKDVGQKITLLVKGESRTIQSEGKIATYGGTFSLSLIPRREYPADQGPMGISLVAFEVKSYPIWIAPLAGLEESIRISGLMLGGLFSMVGQWVGSGQAPTGVAGPIGIAQITGQAVNVGPMAVWQFIGVLSLNLAIINLLPFPALDGSRLVFLGFEAIFRRRANLQIERWTYIVGMFLLIVLILAITYNDILRILNTTSIGAQLRRLLPQD